MSAPASAIVVPVPAADPVVGEWRTRWNPAAAAGLPAAVTLLYPFVAPPVPPSAVDALRAFFALVPPWDVTYASCARFGADVLYVAPEAAAPFVALTDGLVAAWPDHPPYGGAYDSVIPHLAVTIGAPAAAMAEAEAAVTARLPFAARAREAWLVSTGADGRWDVEAKLPFGG